MFHVSPNVSVMSDKPSVVFLAFLRWALIKVLFWTSIFHQPRKSQNVLNFWRYVLTNPDRCKKIVFPAQAEYSYFSAEVRLKIFLWIFLGCVFWENPKTDLWSQIIRIMVHPEGTEESLSSVHSSVPLMYHDKNDLRSQIRFWILPKKRTLRL